MQQVCKNCEASFEGKYCNNCGQKYNVPRFTFKHIFEEAFHAFTHADKSFLSFSWQLLINPGKIAYEYIVERRRKKYFNPFTFFLLISAISAFFTGQDLHLKERLFDDNNEYGHLFNVYNKVLSLIAIPIISFFVWLIYSKKPRLAYAEYTVFSMLLISALEITNIIKDIINFSLTALTHNRYSIDDNAIYLALTLAYTAYASYGFHVRLHKNFIVKELLVGLIYVLVFLGIQLFIIYAFINGFQGLGRFQIFGINFGR